MKPLALLCACGFLLGCDSASPKSDSSKPGKASKGVVTREEFTQTIHDAMRNARAQGNDDGRKVVTLAAGKPDRTHKTETHEFWYYDGRTKNKRTGTMDRTAVVEIDQEGNLKIDFEPGR
jgi:hypothetical protein